MKSLWELKPLLERLVEDDKRLDFKKWGELKKVMDILAIAYTPSIKLQSEKCTYTDMWGIWNLLLLQLAKNSSTLAKNILKALNEREHVIKNPVMYAALFLDPRYKAVLNASEQQIAMIELLSLHNKIERKRAENHSNEDRYIDELELLLMASDINADSPVLETPDSQNADIQKEFDHFKRLARVDKEFPILDFWKQNKTKFPILYQLSQVVFCISNGQTSVERGFSSLDFIYDRRRCNLKSDTLSDILLIRLNQKVLDSLDDSDWNEILKTVAENQKSQ